MSPANRPPVSLGGSKAGGIQPGPGRRRPRPAARRAGRVHREEYGRPPTVRLLTEPLAEHVLAERDLRDLHAPTIPTLGRGACCGARNVEDSLVGREADLSTTRPPTSGDRPAGTANGADPTEPPWAPPAFAGGVDEGHRQTAASEVSVCATVTRGRRR